MKKVLVDDHALFRDGVASLLLVWGHEVAAGSGETDEVLMDVRLPHGEPLAGLRSATVPAAENGRPGEVAIVVLTVSKEEADLFRAIKAGAQGHPPPELEPPRLRSMLEGAARGGAPSRAPGARLVDGFVADPARPAGLPRLTEREIQVLGLVAEGLRNRQIAARMGISENTVKFHLKNVAEKLQASNRAELAARAVRAGLAPWSGQEGGAGAGRRSLRPRRSSFDRP